MLPRTNIRVRFSETDALGHVNNTSYFIYFEEARTDLFRYFVDDLDTSKWNLILASTSCDYKKQARFGQELYVTTEVTKIGNTSFTLYHEIRDAKDESIIATGTAVLVHYDFSTERPVPLSDQQRKKLSSLMKEQSLPTCSDN
ncbi:thioesterase [Collibacillus ludicampi]|jgi:acyl-CoA thioester hydrolase|uniref:Thioesterase n=1 Tax=Collibacillus ludicampi TaxID=2771369 RepID=A0AAV4LH25_9BACL|nr:thioesterase family protein [Collibacillus ludicampi]GIM47131.1 thioesterase [Collibacillus ludicampi]